MKIDEKGRRLDGAPLGYGDYINVDPLVASLRVPRDPPKGVIVAQWPKWPDGWAPGDRWPRDWHHDEALFITTHQAFEIWFRQMLHELDSVLHGARELAEKYGGIPLVCLPARASPLPEPSHWTASELSVPYLEQQKEFYPRLWSVASKLGPGHPLRRIPAPAYHHLDEGPRLGDFDSKWGLWTECVTRAAFILRSMLPFFDVLARMTPASFLEFRGRLSPASGFGSIQFRRIELILGLRERHLKKVSWSTAKDTQEILKERGWTAPDTHESWDESFEKHYGENERRTLIQAFGHPSLRDLVYWLLNSAELQGGSEQRAKRVQHADRLASLVFGEMAEKEAMEVIDPETWDKMGSALAHAEVLGAVWLQCTKSKLRPFNRFLSACVDLDAALMDWRDVHIRFVERMIGRRPGTGGGGLHYLMKTRDSGGIIRSRAFPCLWEARGFLVEPALLADSSSESSAS